MKKKIIIGIAIAIALIIASNVFNNSQKTDNKVVVFGDKTWDSIKVHNRIVAYIIENGLEGYTADYIAGDTIPIVNGVMQGDIDVDMESWHSSFPELYTKAIKSGKLIDLGKNLPDAPQGWWVPRYLVEGENAPAPNLKSVKDLREYKDLFTDPEEPTKGVIYGGCSGWGQLMISEDIFKKSELSDVFNFTVAGSGTALAASMVGSYQKNEAWVGYYWAPTAILGKLDMVMLKGSEYEPADVNILINKDFIEKAPDIVDILKKYSTTVADNNEFLSLKENNEWSAEETAVWFLKNKEEIWIPWVSEDVAKKVKKALLQEV